MPYLELNRLKLNNILKKNNNNKIEYISHELVSKCKSHTISSSFEFGVKNRNINNGAQCNQEKIKVIYCFS